MSMMGVGLQVVGRTHKFVFIVKYFVEGVSSRFSFRSAYALFLSKTVRSAIYLLCQIPIVSLRVFELTLSNRRQIHVYVMCPHLFTFYFVLIVLLFLFLFLNAFRLEASSSKRILSSRGVSSARTSNCLPLARFVTLWSFEALFINTLFFLILRWLILKNSF